FFQAEDGIRDLTVTGVQTCALPIYRLRRAPINRGQPPAGPSGMNTRNRAPPGEPFILRLAIYSDLHFELVRHPHAWKPRPSTDEIGRASCRERVSDWGGVGGVSKR